jgi:thymidine kinase
MKKKILITQFPDVVPAAQELANRGKSVIVAALNGDFRQKVFAFS